jgi:hypothetical protein
VKVSSEVSGRPGSPHLVVSDKADTADTVYLRFRARRAILPFRFLWNLALFIRSVEGKGPLRIYRLPG